MNYGVSALNSFGIRIQVAAYNISNVSTDGFKPATVNLTDGPRGFGVHGLPLMRDGQLAKSGISTPLSLEGQTPSDTDLAREFACMTLDQRSFEANAKTIATIDQMLGGLIDSKT